MVNGKFHAREIETAVREQQVNKKLKLVNIHKPLIYIEILRESSV